MYIFEKLEWKSAVGFLILFVLVDIILFYIAQLCKKDITKKFCFKSLLPNIFAPYIKNVGTCFATLVYFDF